MRVGDLVDGPDEIDPAWPARKGRIVVTAGALAPVILVRRVVEPICRLTCAEIGRLAGVEASVQFQLPKGFAESRLRVRLVPRAATVVIDADKMFLS